MQSSRCDDVLPRVMKWNESVKNGSLPGRAMRHFPRGWTTRKISTPRWSVNGPIDTKARIKRRWLFHLRAEISFAHLGTCRRRHRRPGERAQIERILTRTLKRKRFTVKLDELTVMESVITICCVIAITWWLLTNRISLHLNIHACRMYIIVANCRLLETNFSWKISRREEKIMKLGKNCTSLSHWKVYFYSF